ncbi:sugar ABC transporter ATP-binding protein [Thermotoga neapolitana]|jgi:ABC-type sugar transport system ATPase subunit|uniref:Ribose/galactose/methyl galactoside import ATP-binding protein n=1 Tax=Thermotoga neapolitana (strain ATCC 49049 / DSM 4359 / NBRC 107923 / NS-E) TaxID=309803 RepID=B9KBZ6_THENN|nr:Putative ribose/galactose/methyl galactoside import ATP-binding protein [Thermotoga neapolitana DSM 4359]KFZ22188.1 Putative ribose/galactose/methyl galactoside import ATP-binding protein [Thermotoga neapolitana LA10]
MVKEPILVLKGITKEFPGVKALQSVDLEVFPGEIHALLGENGAGKSTLMKIISGIIEPDSGSIVLDGKKVRFRTPREALNAGIALVHQELSLIPSLSVAENIFLGRWPRGIFGIDWSYINDRAQELLKKFDLRINPRALVRDLSVAEQQIVEILKAISQPHVKLLLLDEPTSALSEDEVERLFELLFEIKKEGKAIIFISHKLDEALRIADRITILRDGKKIITAPRGELTERDVVFYMTGKHLEEEVITHDSVEGSPLLSVRNFSAGVVKNVNLDLYAGEILAIFGLLGSGRTTLARGLFGLEKAEGDILIEGNKVRISSPIDAINAGIGYLPEDRREALVFQFSVSKNITLASFREICRKGILDFRKERELSSSLVEKLRIKTPSLDKRVMYLSGGNQQKVLLARWICRKPRVLILDEPTRGIDVGAKYEIRQLVRELAKEGMGIIYITSEAQEAVEVGDRIAIMRNGKIIKTLKNINLSKGDILAEAGGAVRA